MELYQKVQELGEANLEFLLRYNWEWFCSLNLQSGSDYSMAESKLKAWRIKMGIQDHMLIAYMGAFNTINNPHIHLLLWGKQNRLGRSLLDLNYKDWENEWSRLTQSQSVIQPLYLIYDRDQVASYIAYKNLPWGKSELIQPYNKRLLVKAMVS
jgi:hypothetical protein